MLDMERYKTLARAGAAEGCVLLKNDRKALPLKKGCRVAVFGRNQLSYHKSGTGSGGLVNTAYVVSILDGLKASTDVLLDESLLKTYENWVEEHPFDKGCGWAQEPWCQEEMPLTEALVNDAAERSDVAVICIGRLAGEDRDNSAVEGSYLLTAREEKMLELVCARFSKTVVLLNVGNIIDMKWVKRYDPAAVLYVWQGGQEGGNGVADVLTGRVDPSGKLTDTIPWDIMDNPTARNFGDAHENVFSEDIYVGYRYFETFAKDKALYPFGFGLSYTTFDMQIKDFRWDGGQVTVSVAVKNTGSCAGKEVAQLYVSAPQGKLGKAARVLCGFAKTKCLQPGEEQTLTLHCDRYVFASYDDSGISGHPSAYVLEKGTYRFYYGNDVRSELLAGSFALQETVVVEQLSAALSPVRAFDRLRAVQTEDGVTEGWEAVPLRKYDLNKRIWENAPAAAPYTGDMGYRLKDVKEGKVPMETFAAQLSTKELATLLRGEGMCSPKVTAGTAAAFGGLSEGLKGLGVPVACCSDGPSGIRMDVGTIAFALPNGTCLASSFNEELSTELFEMLGLELRKNQIDVLLGPGMNLHRCPLNGRNFEYFSEDPFLTGKMASAQLRGLHRHRVTGAIKHFAGNTQEFCRHTTNNVISERALRELYLKGFEIACREGDAKCVMSTYGPVNGLWTASNYDLLTHILRKEWGFRGMVMTDWWARGNEEGEEGSRKEMAAMVRSQNDIYMVVGDSENNSSHDNLMEGLESGKVALGHLRASAMNVLSLVMDLPAMDRFLGQEESRYAELYSPEDQADESFADAQLEVDEGGEIPVELLQTDSRRRVAYYLRMRNYGRYRVELTLRSKTEHAMAQMPVTVFKYGQVAGTMVIQGSDKEWKTYYVELGDVLGNILKLDILFSQPGVEVKSCRICQCGRTDKT